MPNIKINLFILLLLVGLLSLPSYSYASRFVFSPSSGTYNVDQRFSIDVSINTEGAIINAAEAILIFPSNTLRVESISSNGSIFKFWSQDPTHSNSLGQIKFGGGLPSPGINSSRAKIITITFQGISAGSGYLRLEEGSILANDGVGTDTLSGIQEANYKIAEKEQALETNEEEEIVVTPLTITTSEVPAQPKVTSKTHPSEDVWYNRPTFEASWDMSKGITGVNYALLENSSYTLPKTSRGIVSSASYDLSKLNDGMWYFYTSLRNANGWSEVFKRKVKIDTTSPQEFSITQALSNDPTDPRPAFKWATEDETSGIEKYMIRIENGEWLDSSTLNKIKEAYVLPTQLPGTRTIEVKAYDKAGNTATAKQVFTVEPLPPPQIIEYTQKISSPSEPFKASGKALAGTHARIILVKGDKEVVVPAITDKNGNWTTTFSDRLSSGKWILTAHAEDSRGAISLATTSQTIEVASWYGQIAGFMLGYGIIIAFGILLFTFMVALTYYLIHQMKMWRLGMQRELYQLKMAVSKDLEDIEKQISPSKTRSATKIRKKIVHLKAHLDKIS